MVLGDVDGVPSTPQTGPNKGYKTWGEPLLSQSGLLSSAGSEAICFLPSSPPGIAKYTLYIKGQNTFNILRMLANYRCFVPFRESTFSWFSWFFKYLQWNTVIVYLTSEALLLFTKCLLPLSVSKFWLLTAPPSGSCLPPLLLSERPTLIMGPLISSIEWSKSQFWFMIKCSHKTKIFL